MEKMAQSCDGESRQELFGSICLQFNQKMENGRKKWLNNATGVKTRIFWSQKLKIQHRSKISGVFNCLKMLLSKLTFVRNRLEPRI